MYIEDESKVARLYMHGARSELDVNRNECIEMKDRCKEQVGCERQRQYYVLGVSDERYNCKGTTYCFCLHRSGCCV